MKKKKKKKKKKMKQNMSAHAESLGWWTKFRK